MDHNIIHHTESIPAREPLTEEQADKLIEQYGDMFPETPLLDWQRTVLRSFLTGTREAALINRRGGRSTVLIALGRIEEARAHGLA